MPTGAGAGCRATPSSPPAIEHAEAGFPAWEQLHRAIERHRREPRRRTVGGGLPERLAARGAAAATRRARPAPGPRRDPQRSPTMASTRTTTATSASGWQAASRRPAASHTVEDLRRAQSEWTTPIATTYRGTRVTTHPPNSSGVVALQSAQRPRRASSRPPGARFGDRGWTDARWIHLQLEVAKRALAERDRSPRDPAFRDVPVERAAERRAGRAIAATIDPDRADATPPACRMLVGGTIWLGVVDAEGNAVSLIQSNAAGFGSGVLDPETGVHFQNRGASFSLDAASPNVLEPGKRPAHTLMPGMLFREGERRPWVVAGSMGGDIQPQIHVALVSALVDGGATDRAGRGRAAGRRRAGRALRAARRGVRGRRPGGRRRGGPGGDRPPAARTPFDGSLGHEHAIELVDGGPAAGGTLAATTDPRSAGLPAAR